MISSVVRRQRNVLKNQLKNIDFIFLKRNSRLALHLERNSVFSSFSSSSSSSSSSSAFKSNILDDLNVHDEKKGDSFVSFNENVKQKNLDDESKNVSTVPGSLGPYKLIIEDLPKNTNESELLKALHMEFNMNDFEQHQQQRQQRQLSDDGTKIEEWNEEEEGEGEEDNDVDEGDEKTNQEPFAIEFFVDRQFGRLRRNAFVYFVNEKDVKNVLRKASKFGVHIRGQRCSIYSTKSKTTLFIGNLPYSIVEEEHLKEILQQVVRKEPFIVDLSKGFAFLKFQSHESALRAFAMLQDPSIWKSNTNRPIIIRWAAQRKTEKTSVKELMSQINRLQSELYKLKLENTELLIRLKDAEGK